MVRGVHHGSVGDLVLNSVHYHFKETLPNHSKHIRQKKHYCSPTALTKYIQCRNSLAVLVDEKCSLKSLQGVSVFISNNLLQILSICSADVKICCKQTGVTSHGLKAAHSLCKKQKSRYRNQHLTILMHSCHKPMHNKLK